MFYDCLEKKTIPGDHLAGRTAARRCRILCDHRGRGPQRFLMVWYGQGVKGSGEKERRIKFGVEHIADAWFVWVLCQHSWCIPILWYVDVKVVFLYFPSTFLAAESCRGFFLVASNCKMCRGRAAFRIFQESIWSDDSDGPNQQNTPGARLDCVIQPVWKVLYCQLGSMM